MNPFDSIIASFLNQFAQRSFVFDQAVAFLSVNHLLKGGLMMAFFWWAWFRRSEPQLRYREHLLATLLSSVFAMAVARLLVFTLPFRQRPLYEPSLELVRPFGVAEGALDNLSSFPSDHAVLFFCLAAGLFFVSRAMGWFALLYTIFFIALPRMYLGLHYPTDILAGALLGTVVAVAGNLLLPRRGAVQWLTAQAHAKPALFYPLFFLVSYQFADLFENARSLAGGVAHVMVRAVS